MTVDYYHLLSISPNASPREIKAAYRRLAEVYHPDKMRELPPSVRREGEEIMRLLNEAKAALLDPPRPSSFDEGIPQDHGIMTDAIIVDEEDFNDFVIEDDGRELDGKMRRVLRGMKEVFVRDRTFQKKIALAEEIVDAQIIEDAMMAAENDPEDPTEMTLEFAVVSRDDTPARKKKKAASKKFKIVAIEYDPERKVDDKK